MVSAKNIDINSPSLIKAVTKQTKDPKASIRLFQRSRGSCTKNMTTALPKKKITAKIICSISETGVRSK